MADKTSGVTKMDGVRRAMSDLGVTAQPVAIQTYVKQKFGLEMSTGHVSNYKSAILREGKGKSGAKKAAPAPAVKTVALSKPAPVAAAAPKPSVSANGRAAGISLPDIEAVKVLVGRVGADNLTSLIDLLSK